MTKPTRREVLAGTLAASASAAASLALPFGTGLTFGIAPAHAEGGPRFHRFALGDFEVTILSDGRFDQVPATRYAIDQPEDMVKAYLRDHGEPDDRRVTETNVVVIRTPSDVVMVDVGAGLNFTPTTGKLPASLEMAGISPDEITRVVLTHAHGDHIWGILDEFGEDLVYADAEHIVAAAEWDFWMADGIVDQLPDHLKGFALGARRTFEAIADRVTKAGPDHVVTAGVSLMSTPGHTPGHTSVLVESGAGKLLIGGDALHHHLISFDKPDWQFVMDYDHEMAVATRRRLLADLGDSGMLFSGYHMTWPGVGRVERAGEAYRFVVAG